MVPVVDKGLELVAVQVNTVAKVERVKLVETALELHAAKHSASQQQLGFEFLHQFMTHFCRAALSAHRCKYHSQCIKVKAQMNVIYIIPE